MIKGVIFDADGTLLDSMGFWTSTVYDLINAAGITEIDPKLINILTPMSMTEGAIYMKQHFGLTMSVERIIEIENERVLNFYNTEVKLRSGMYEMVRGYHDNGIPMVVASATERSMIISALTHTGIIDMFEEVLSCSDIGRGKDFPDIFMRACEIMHTLPGETLVVEDSPIAEATAAAAGFRTMIVSD